MQFRKYTRFIKSFQYNKITGEVSVLVDCAYQKDKKALFEIGNISEIRDLINRLERIKNFVIEQENK